jgi:hypothetical protein
MKDYILACVVAVALYLGLHFIMWSEPALLIVYIVVYKSFDDKYSAPAMLAALITANLNLLIWVLRAGG